LAALPAEKRAQLSGRWPVAGVQRFTLMESASAAEEPDTEDSGLKSTDNLSVPLGAQVHFVVCVPALRKTLFAL
jgi:hypothetical protein